MASPYDNFGNEAFWSRSVARGFDAVAFAKNSEPYFRNNDRVVSAGSCFAANIIPYITSAGFDYLYTERRPPLFRAPGENLSYDKFSASYGNIYTSGQLKQLIERCLGHWVPIENVWEEDQTYIDPFRPGLRYKARSRHEYDILTHQHLRSVKRAFTAATVFVFTLGLTECWLSKEDGAVFPACPGTVGGRFNSDKHAFKNLSLAEVVDDLRAFVTILRSVNPGVRIILTVSPVPLVATANGKHVLSATIYSKSVLRVAVEEICNEFDDVFYFPAYEIVTGPQAPYDSFDVDRRNVSPAAIETVMNALLQNSEGLDRHPGLLSQTPAPPNERDKLQKLARSFIEYECEEAMQDKQEID